MTHISRWHSAHALRQWSVFGTAAPALGRELPLEGLRREARRLVPRAAKATRVAENVLSHQSNRGDWPKNLDTSAKPYRRRPSKLRGDLRQRRDRRRNPLPARAFARHGSSPRIATPSRRPRPRPGRPVSQRRLAANLPARQGIPALHHVQRQHDGQPPGAGPRRGAVRRLPVRRPPRRDRPRAGLRRGDRLHPQVPGQGRRPADRLVRPARREDAGAARRADVRAPVAERLRERGHPAAPDEPGGPELRTLSGGPRRCPLVRGVEAHGDPAGGRSTATR